MLRKNYYWIIKSPIGKIGIIWTRTFKNTKILRIVMPSTNPGLNEILELYRPRIDRTDLKINRIVQNIGAYFKGKEVKFALNYLDLDQLYPFQKKVLLEECKVPYGHVTTYGRLAGKIGVPGAARAVGNALAKNPFPLIIPCHRTIRADRQIGGYQGGVEMKRYLLRLEGIRVSATDRVTTFPIW